MDRNYDNLIIKVLFNNNGRLNGRRTDKILANKYPNILAYLNNRYKDSTCLRETLLRIYFHIEERPVCLNCSKPVEFIGKKKKMYASFCCCKCNNIYHNLGKKWQQTQINYNLNHYGVKYNFQVESVKKKRTQTLIEKYGVDHPLSNSDIHKKFLNALVKNHDGKSVKWIYKNVIMKKSIETSLERYGVKYPMQTKEFQNKKWNTQKKNNTLTKSKEEDKCYEIFCDVFNKDNVIRQYKCDKYPWRCDFYIPIKNLLIEYQGYFTHGEHPFDSNNIEDIKRLNELKEKYKPYYYKNGCWPQIITIWTEKDVEKRNTAIKNGFNYLEFYNLNQVKDYVKSIKK